MENFYKEWLRKNAEEDKRGLAQLQNEPSVAQNLQTNNTNEEPQPSTSTAVPHPISPNLSSRERSPQPSTSRGINTSTPIQKTANDIVYERDGLQLLVERGIFQRQKKFSLQVGTKVNKCIIL